MSSDTLDEKGSEATKAKRKRSTKVSDVETHWKEEVVTGNGIFDILTEPTWSEMITFASHLTGHSEITIKAMYQEWVVNKNAPFKPL